MSKIRKNLIASVLGQVIAMICGFILPRMILEHFGSEINGLMQSISQFLGVIGFLDMGVGQVVRSALYRPLEDHDSAQISRIMVSGGRFYRKIAYALLVYVGILLFLYPLLVDQSFGWMYTASLIVIMAIGSFMQYYFGVIQEQLLHASQKSYLISYIQILCHLGNLMVCICLIRMNCSVHAVKLATAFMFIIRPIFSSIYVCRKYSVNWNVSYEEEPITQKWHGVAQHISAVVLDGTDNIVLTMFSTLSNVSIYSVYYMVIGSIQGFYQSAAAGIQSAAGNMWAKQNPESIRKMHTVIEFAMHTVTVFLFCCTGILIVPFVQVYTNGLTDANYLQPIFAAILVLAYGIRCLRTPYNIWILAAGHFKQTQKCHITAAGLNLVISIIAVSRWGLPGVAVGTLVAMCYQTAWMAIYATRNLIRCPLSCVAKHFFADAFSAIAVLLATSRITLQNVSYLGWFIMAMKVAVIAFACVFVTSLLFRRKEMVLLVSKISRRGRYSKE